MKSLCAAIAVAAYCVISSEASHEIIERANSGRCHNFRGGNLMLPTCPTEHQQSFQMVASLHDAQAHQFHGDEKTIGSDLPNDQPSPYSNDNPSCTEHLAHINDKLCVYAYPSFHSNRGISIFTTPEIRTAFEERLSTLTSTTRDSISDLNTLHPSLDIQPLPSRGLGVLTTLPIPVGTPLLTSHPILLVHNHPTSHPFSREPHLQHAISLLPNTTAHKFNTLARSLPTHPNVFAQDIIKSNAFTLDIASSPHLAIFPEAARFNHDCAPNAMYHIDHLGLKHSVVATRDLVAGEEVTISYIDPLSPAAWRREELRSAFGFECACARCEDAEADDKLLTEMRELEGVLGDWEPQLDELEGYDDDDNDVTGKAERLIEIYQQLGLQGFMNTAYGHAALAYNSAGEGERATGYATRALEVARVRHGGGSGSRAVKVWEEFLEGGARAHWSWGWRRRG